MRMARLWPRAFPYFFDSCPGVQSGGTNHQVRLDDALHPSGACSCFRACLMALIPTSMLADYGPFSSDSCAWAVVTRWNRLPNVC